jgi:hypothetical protein
MARRLVPLLVIASFALLVFAFAGCGGDDDSSASDDTTLTETTTTEETTEDETTEEETTETEDTDTTETTETSASDDFATSENCEEFAKIGAQVSEAVTGTADVDEIKAAFDELAAAAPDDIKPDFEVLAEYMTAVADALGGADIGAGETPDASALAKLAQLDATEATTASTNISRWVTENCTGATP